MRIFTNLICCVFGGCILNGCGLVFVPDAVTLPPKQLQTILVVDQETKLPITNAEVSCYMGEYKNWLVPFPRWGCKSPPEKTPDITVGSSDREFWTWDGKTQGNGIFKVDSKTKVGSVQIWFPLPLPLGWHLYRSYCGSVSISAPGYKTVWINNRAINFKGDVIGVSFDSLDPDKFILIEKKQATIMLPKDKKTPNKLEASHPPTSQ